MAEGDLFNDGDSVGENETEPSSSEDYGDWGESAARGSIDDLSTADLEDAYLKALDALESADWAVADVETDEVESEPIVDQESTPGLSVTGGDAGVPMEIAGADFLGASALASPPVELTSTLPLAPVDNFESSSPTGANETSVAERATQAKPSRVIEACLFVGGQPLSAKKLASLLDGNNDPARIEVLIDELNLEYAAQARPYEIRLGDGGYRLALRTEFDAVRGRVYGVGPRDVKLSQDVLEVLALVAYQQPISQASIEACKPNSANILRQLLRRELISLTRVDQSRNGVEYRTTPRFLQLFGLGQLSELPRPEDLSIR